MKLCFLPSIGLTLIGLAISYAKIHLKLKKIGKEIQKKSIQDHVSFELKEWKWEALSNTKQWGQPLINSVFQIII